LSVIVVLIKTTISVKMINLILYYLTNLSSIYAFTIENNPSTTNIWFHYFPLHQHNLALPSHHEEGTKQFRSYYNYNLLQAELQCAYDKSDKSLKSCKWSLDKYHHHCIGNSQRCICFLLSKHYKNNTILWRA